MTTQTIVVGSDHAGLVLKQYLADQLRNKGYQVLDVGTDTDASVDYPDFGEAAAQKIISGEAQTGVIICGSGIGISIAANRHPEIRAALCYEPELAALARQHNNANVLALGERFITKEKALACLDTFLSTAFEGGRHQRRVDKLSSLPPSS